MKINIPLLLFYLLSFSLYPQSADMTTQILSSLKENIDEDFVFQNNKHNHIHCSHPEINHQIEKLVSGNTNRIIYSVNMDQTPYLSNCPINDQQKVVIVPNLLSNDDFKGNSGKTVTYNWQFKLNRFFASNGIIHQINVNGGYEANVPLFSLNLTGKNEIYLELQYAEDHENNVLQSVNINDYKNKWIAVEETVTYNEIGAYSIIIRDVDTQKVLLEYSQDALRTWRSDAKFLFPVWGFFNSSKTMHDAESLWFTEITATENDFFKDLDAKLADTSIEVFPNPASSVLNIKTADLEDYESIELNDSFGRKIALQTPVENQALDVSKLKNGIYFLVFKKNGQVAAVKKFLKF